MGVLVLSARSCRAWVWGKKRLGKRELGARRNPAEQRDSFVSTAWLANRGAKWAQPGPLAGRCLHLKVKVMCMEERVDPGRDAGLFGPESVSWRVLREGAVVVGGLRALLMHAAHPLVVAGARPTGMYERDPWRRLEHRRHPPRDQGHRRGDRPALRRRRPGAAAVGARLPGLELPGDGAPHARQAGPCRAPTLPRGADDHRGAAAAASRVGPAHGRGPGRLHRSGHREWGPAPRRLARATPARRPRPREPSIQIRPRRAGKLPRAEGRDLSRSHRPRPPRQRDRQPQRIHPRLVAEQPAPPPASRPRSTTATLPRPARRHSAAVARPITPPPTTSTSQPPLSAPGPGSSPPSSQIGWYDGRGAESSCLFIDIFYLSPYRHGGPWWRVSATCARPPSGSTISAQASSSMAHRRFGVAVARKGPARTLPRARSISAPRSP